VPTDFFSMLSTVLRIAGAQPTAAVSGSADGVASVDPGDGDGDGSGAVVSCDGVGVGVCSVGVGSGAVVC